MLTRILPVILCLPAMALADKRARNDALFTNGPGHGVWFEAVVPDTDGRWYGFYHHERPADDCGRPDRQLPRIGAARSLDFGATWEDLGIVIDALPDTAACDSDCTPPSCGDGHVNPETAPAEVCDAAGESSTSQLR